MHPSPLHVSPPGSNSSARVKGRPHTLESRQKISAANRGKVPWNKGRSMSQETKDKIRQGVLRRLDEKERLNPKTPDLNKKESTRKRGDPLSDEIRAKISETMKKKWANSTYAEERKKAREALYESAIINATQADGSVDYSKVNVIGMAGRKHSKETREKISQTLKARWETEDGFRDRMVTMMKMARGNEEGKVPEETRKKISQKLKKRWREEEGFRDRMMLGIKTRALASSPRAEEHRKRISDAIKAKWTEDDYRKRATDGINRSLKERAAKGTLKNRGSKKNTSNKKSLKEKTKSVKEEEVNVANKQEISFVKEDVKSMKTKTKLPAKEDETETIKHAKKATKSVERGMQPPSSTLVTAQRPKQQEEEEVVIDMTEVGFEDEPKEAHLHTNLSDMAALKQERYSELSRDVWNLLYGDDDEFVDDDDADGSLYATTAATRGGY
ncbi:hypothetical protein TrCOL_g13348 [Triparma columacea]|uniref:Nuclease associated modular domain-containing protein n=1 Tax=Triparma columacea TaxID=722753 RepID=A0A9W7GNL3_9STRA|nr:hypothetical protein TrCOL_g13348 [Triparma columacea]